MFIDEMKVNMIKQRFGGCMFKRTRAYYGVKKHPSYPFEKDQLKRLLAEHTKVWLKEFFCVFGSQGLKRERNISLMKIYNCFCDIYTPPQDASLLDFNGIVVAKPDREIDKVILAWEVTDFFLYYLIDDIAFCDMVCGEGPYEFAEVRVSASGTHDHVIIDCGANMGLFSAMSSRKGAKVYAFEPDKYTIENHLSKTAQLNPNINICEYALLDKEGKICFTQDTNHIGMNKISSAETAKSNDTIVQAITLDAFVEKHDIPRVDFIKADIEGAERYMLMGAKQVLKEYAPKISICTYHRPDDAKVLRGIILDANPHYIVEGKFSKMYAYVK